MPQLKLKKAPLKKRTSPLYNWQRLLLASAILIKGLCQRAMLAFTPEASTRASLWPWWSNIYGISSNSGVTQAGMTQCSVVMSEGHVIAQG